MKALIKIYLFIPMLISCVNCYSYEECEALDPHIKEKHCDLTGTGTKFRNDYCNDEALKNICNYIIANATSVKIQLKGEQERFCYDATLPFAPSIGANGENKVRLVVVKSDNYVVSMFPQPSHKGCK